MKRYNSLVMILSAVALAGCGSGVKKTLGLERSAPDEFAVVERAPLVVPPNFNLVPPDPGAPRPQENHVSDTAKGLVLGSQSSAPKAANGSAAETSLLKQAGAAQSDPNIRKQLAVPEAEKPKTAAEKLGLLGTSEPEGKALDPVEEAKKLQQKNIKTVPVEQKAVDAPKTAPKK